MPTVYYLKVSLHETLKMHNGALQPYGCAQIDARRVPMPCLIMHAF